MTSSAHNAVVVERRRRVFAQSLHALLTLSLDVTRPVEKRVVVTVVEIVVLPVLLFALTTLWTTQRQLCTL